MRSSISKRQFLPEQVTDLHHTKSQFCTSVKKKVRSLLSHKIPGWHCIYQPFSLLTPPVSAWLSTLKPPAYSTTSKLVHACKRTCKHLQTSDAYWLKYPTPALGGRSRKSNQKNVQTQQYWALMEALTCSHGRFLTGRFTWCYPESRHCHLQLKADSADGLLPHCGHWVTKRPGKQREVKGSQKNQLPSH